MADTSTTAAYARDAAKLVAQYESYTFETVFAKILHLFPEKSCRVLDIGAGSGRWAAALARRGHEVLAVEPTREMREAGQALHPMPSLTWIDDALPELALLHGDAHAASYGLVLMAAVIMHFDEAERDTTVRRAAELLVPGGRCIITLRHGPIPEGRRMFSVTHDNVITQAARYGLTPVFHTLSDDVSGRPGVSWTLLCLDKAAA